MSADTDASDAFARDALAAFDAVLAAGAGELRPRPGQRRMAEAVAQTFCAVTLGKPEQTAGGGEAAPRRAIAVIQAGTGVGKSLAYSAPAIALALARGTRVLISTATVALQEQLVNKDLPQLAAQMPQPFRFALAKGRGRYVCKLKLNRLSGGEEVALFDEDAEPDEPLDAGAASRHSASARLQFYASLTHALASKLWDGDRDSLPTPPEADLWAPVGADARSCTGRHCPLFGQCSYYERRKELVGAQVIVANHDLLLSSLGARLLPELDHCLLVLDEAHHLPATALDQFSHAMDLSRTLWLERLATRVVRTGGLLAVSEVVDVPRLAGQIRQTLADLARLAMDAWGDTLRAGGDAFGPARVRLPRGALPEAFDEPLQLLQATSEALLAAVSAVARALKAEIRDKPDEARRLSALYAQIGTLAPRLDDVYATARALLAPPVTAWRPSDAAPDASDAPAGEGGLPMAKWFSSSVEGDFVVLRAHASPILSGATLRTHLWPQVRGAVLTSATLTSCGQFDFFLRESGLAADPDVRALEVESPFDYATQGRFTIVETRADPKDAAAFNAELAERLVADLAAVERGALVLFTSREQMRVAVQALPEGLRARVWVQTEWPRSVLLARHRERVAAGEPSIIFGMQSFGEGLDLPGALCEHLFITKLPFASPDDPVEEARAEWLRAAGRDPFNELVIPATAIRLAQWAGRAIRTETDHAYVTCYDRRLTRTGYGKRLLRGLPGFPLVRRDVEGRETALG
ncbi:ATP-dependent DNA helicase DinG [Tibeticola sediminis]|uniref:ATP-dependent DNA helicase DinG n=1 Tax=Tibeticola sediminis TaxID=1917811 RepID=A0A3N4V068_9BURK|nr:ATP-dependent DNA helicase DinG [Tibeticola sediminis]RPE73189.1 ATP-dependent DNA helicase DinG [Tibeticola sediminis]